MAYPELRWPALACAGLRILAIPGHPALVRQIHDLRDSCSSSPCSRPSLPVRSRSLPATSGIHTETGLTTASAARDGLHRSPFRESGTEDCGAPSSSKV